MEKLSNALQLRALLSFLNKDKKTCTVTGIAQMLGEQKYTISRVLQDLENRGLIDRSDHYKPKLTEAGEALAQYYNERVMLSQNHLIYEGVDLESAKSDAYMWALYNTDETMEVLRKAEAVNMAKYELRRQKQFGGEELCRHFSDGIYHVPFFLYRETAHAGSNLSMGNAGFEHPAELYIKGGEGIFHLRARQLEIRYGGSGRLIRGGVESMKYFDAGAFLPADASGSIFSFPAAAVRFENVGQGMHQFVHGSLTVKIRATVGEDVMPESAAIFTVII